MPNVSFIAFYGDKSLQLTTFINKIQAYLVNHELIQDRFIPYQPEQIHGTIIGCEGFKIDSGVINQWFYEHRQETRYIDFPGLINHLQHQVNFPLSIRFGGYDRHTNYNFFSRNQHLYFRSFQLQPVDNQTIPILIGWSWENYSVSLAIDNLRRDLQQFNLLHKYHVTSDAMDNDFYLRLGTINGKLNSEEINAIATDIRNILESQLALYFPINLNDLAFAQYQDLSLTPAKTKVIPVGEITANQLEQLYLGLTNAI
ncbi:MAG: hypothetical protein ACFCU7_16290 [Pleurocapsa sp.]